ncbi:MAG: hypothetical protein IJ347_01965 [Faecalibacterium sp.]|nr:hypothetical protein [Faecalibacterium sp.]
MMQKLRRRPVEVMLCYLAVYQLCFVLLERWQRPYHLVHCRLDAYIPFHQVWVVPYVLWFVWVPLTLLWFLKHSEGLFWRLFAAIALGNTVATGVFAVWPTIQLRRRTLYGSDVFTSLIRFIYTVDTPTNVCPSLHTSVSVAILLAVLASGMGKSGKLAHTVITVAICLSTVIIRQHSCVDVLWGAVLSLAMWYLVDAVMLRSHSPKRKKRLRLHRA